MTVPVSDRLSQLYVGNGTNTRFDFTFRIFDQEDESGITVRVKNGTEFEEMDKTLYRVSTNQDEMSGYVLFNTAPDSQTYFYIAGQTPVDQLLDITNYDNFYPDAIERALDKTTAILQEWAQNLTSEKASRLAADTAYDLQAIARENEIRTYLDGPYIYGDSISVPVIQVDANGKIIKITTTPIVGSGGSYSVDWQNITNMPLLYNKTEVDNVFLKKSDNLSALTDTATARSNLNVYGKTETYSTSEINNKLPVAATTSVVGTTRYATSAEVKAGTVTSAAVTPKAHFDASFGVGQTWQDMTSSRVLDTTYTNSTGKPIMVSIKWVQKDTDSTTFIYVDGFIVDAGGQSGTSGGGALQAIVPAGSTYKRTGATQQGVVWMELR